MPRQQDSTVARSGGSSARMAFTASLDGPTLFRTLMRPASIWSRDRAEGKRYSARWSDPLPAHLFRRHVAGRAEHHAGSVSSGARSRVRPPSGVLAQSSFARPKSRILTRPSAVTNTFSGFRSRCTMPFVRGREAAGDLRRAVEGLSDGTARPSRAAASRLRAARTRCRARRRRARRRRPRACSDGSARRRRAPPARSAAAARHR